MFTKSKKYKEKEDPTHMHNTFPTDVQIYLITTGRWALETMYTHARSSWEGSGTATKFRDYMEKVSFWDSLLDQLESQNVFTSYKGKIATLDQKQLCYSQFSNMAVISNGIRRACASDDKDYIRRRKTHLIWMISICWALYDAALKQNEPCARGSLSIKDPEHVIYFFFRDYVKRVNDNCETPESLPYLQTVSNFAYRRDPKLKGSSHHRDRCPESQFGIDMRWKPHTGLEKILPYHNTHILFGRLRLGDDDHEPLLFLKLEEIGLGSIYAAAAHGLNFAGPEKLKNLARRESSTIPEIKKAMENFRKHGVQNPDSVRTLVHHANHLLSSGEHPTEAHEEAKTFLELLNKLYPNGNHHLRIGHEVIIDVEHHGIVPVEKEDGEGN
jgi:hypothetical protein